MAEYIDKNKVVLNYGGLAKIAPNDNAGIAKYFSEQIKAIPADDVAPVRHGRWLDMETEPKCSVCGKYSANDKYATIYYAYCPHCGAKMYEEE